MSAALQAVKRFRARELQGLTKTRPKVQNPFLPHKNPESGRWAPPKYSLRRQADLVKQARASGTLHLLPFGPKLSLKDLQSAIATVSSTPATSSAPETSSGAQLKPQSNSAAPLKRWERSVTWVGEFKEKEMKGAEVGNRLYGGRKRMFKGHKWERTLEKRTSKRKMLMKDMKERIERFRTTYKRKTPSPISPARPVSYSKLPF